jgi:DHA1 family tetracycline resistance protein-like MFS transporter
MENKMESKSPILILFLVVLIDMIGFTLVIPFLTYFIQDLAELNGIVDLGVRDRWVGITLAAYTFGQFLFTPILGTLSDKLGRRPILLAGLISNSVFLLAFGLSGSLGFALVVRFLAGVGNANIAVSRAYIGDISQPEQLAGRMGMIGAAFGLGFMIGPFIGGVLSNPADVIGGFFDTEFWRLHPYLLPCIFASSLSTISLILAYFKLPETLSITERKVRIKSPLKTLKTILGNLIKVKDLAPSVRLLILINAIFLLSFTMMHATFILFTGMEVIQGGLGFDAKMNGYLFAYVGLVGVIVQGGLIRPLSEKYNHRSLMVIGILTTGFGLASIPYLQREPLILGLIVLTFISVGNSLFQPTQSTLLTMEARYLKLDLGRVMGSQEGFGALSRVIGPLFAAFVWEATFDGEGIWTYHTVFRICGILMVIAAIIQLKLKLSTNSIENS